MKNKKQLFLILSVVSLTITYGYFFVNNQKKIRQEKFKKSEIEFIANTTKKQKKTKLIQQKNKNKELLVYIPLTEENKSIVVIEEKMLHLGTQILENSEQEKSEKIILTARAENLQPNIKQYNYFMESYEWHSIQQEWLKKEKRKIDSSLLNNQSQKKLTLGDIFKNQKNLLKINHLLQKKYLENSQQPTQDILAILDLPTLLVDETNFSFFSDRVVVELRKNKLNLEEVVLPYEDYGEFVNKDFVDARFVKESAPEKRDEKEKKRIALTFDDGPNDSSTLEVLKILKKEKISATFFLLGMQVDKFPKITKQIADEKHEIANHSYSHLNLDTLDEIDIKKEINLTQASIYKATGKLPEFVRPPYGSVSYSSAVTIGLPIVNWNIDSLDWKSRDAKKIIKEVETYHETEGILLMHDIHKESLEALPSIIEFLRKEDYTFVTISELLEVIPEPLTIYYNGEQQKELTK